MMVPGGGATPDPVRWNDTAAHGYRDALTRARAAGEARRGALQRDAARATDQWRGVARSDFDERTMCLVATLHDLEQCLTSSLAWLEERQRAADAHAVPTPGFVPPSALLGAAPRVPDRPGPGGG